LINQEKLKSGKADKKSIVPISDIPKDVKDYVINILKEPNYFDENQLTELDIKKLQQGIKRFQLGVQANVIQTCTTNCESYGRCPLALLKRPPISSDCHPPKELILTSTHGEVPIEELNPSIHRLPTFFIKMGSITGTHYGAKNFRIVNRQYHGTMVSITTESGKTYKCTKDHLCVTRFNDNADNKFCVYLMKKGELWRIGKSFISRLSTVGQKRHHGVLSRLRGENADALWILGIYNTNTEAFLAEEYFSLYFQISKVCFAASIKKKEHKSNGVYKWATKKQLEEHHESLKKPRCFYEKMLAELGLSIDHPYMIKGGFKDGHPEKGPCPRYPMIVRASNLIPGIMNMAVIPKKEIIHHTLTRRYRKCKWERVTEIKKEPYNGIVYSLDVEGPHHTYFAGKIATHNCPIELDLYEKHTAAYKEAVAARVEYFGTEIDIESDHIVKTLIAELVEADIIELRANAMIATIGIVEEVPAIVSEEGVEYRLDEATALKIKREQKKRRDINFRQLLATPEMVQRSKAKAATAEPNQRIEETRKKARDLMEKTTISVEGKVIEDGKS